MLIPWFAAATCLTILTKVIELACEARAELNRMLALQATYLLVFVGLLALAIGREAVAFAIALTAGELLRHLAFMVLARRLLGIHLARQGGAYVPGAVGALGVGATVLAVQQPLRALHAPDPVTLVVCIAAAALALALCIRFNPVGQVRRDLRQRLTAGGTLRGRGARAAALLLGPDRRPRPAQSTRAPATGEDRDAKGEH